MGAARKTKKLGVLTSGGDAPGMNAVIRALVRTAVRRDIKIIGVMRGFEGLISGEIQELNSGSVSDIIQNGGTILLTARCQEMTTDEGADKAANVCHALGLDGLAVIGGNGSMRGALALMKRGVNVFGVPGTIDLDMDCTDYTVGFDTAVNTAMDAMNKIRDTSTSHERCSLVEVMGRHAGHIALWCGLTSGAEEVLLPEADAGADELIQLILENRSKGKTHNLVIVAEGLGGTAELAGEIERVTGIATRATILGYLQRGGSPTALDRMHGSVMGHLAAEVFGAGEKNRMIVFREGRHTHMDMEEAVAFEKPEDDTMYKIIKTLAI